MSIRPDIDRNRVKTAQDEFEMAESRLDSALQYTRESDEPNHADNFVQSQRCVERSTKAVFKLMEVQCPDSHSIGPSSHSGRNLLNAISDEVTSINFPAKTDGFLTGDELVEMHVRDVSRLMFLCKMYGNMYTLASYGIDEPDFHISPNKFIEYAEEEVIVESAVTSLRISDAIIDSISTGELPRTSKPTGQQGPMECRSGIDGGVYGVGKHLTEHDPVSDYRREL